VVFDGVSHMLTAQLARIILVTGPWSKSFNWCACSSCHCLQQMVLIPLDHIDKMGLRTLTLNNRYLGPSLIIRHRP
jgi:hypothetical protein